MSQRQIIALAAASLLQGYLMLTGYVPEGDNASRFSNAEAAVLLHRRPERSGVAGLANTFVLSPLVSTIGGLGEQFAWRRWTFPPRASQCQARVLAAFLGAAPSERAQLIFIARHSALAYFVAATFDLSYTST